ncbi:hypothetical protein BDV12DRAFT_185933 [Aspergillus spectabilis]
MASSTTVIFIPIIALLEAARYKTDLVHLPSVELSTPHSGFSQDKVIVVVHSYGGLPGNEAIQGLDWGTRQRNAQPGGVTHLVFCCSFIVPEGKSLISSIGGNDLPWLKVSSDRLIVTPADPEQIFYNDTEEEEQRNFHSIVTYAGWKDVPSSTYLYCLKDQAMPIAVQKMMVEEVAKEFPIWTETLNASHSPFYSVPDDVAFAIKRAAGEDV